MTDWEIAYLTLVAGGMLAFILGLAYVTWDENRSRSTR